MRLVSLFTALTHSFTLVGGQILCSASSALPNRTRVPTTALAVVLCFYMLRSFLQGSFESKEGVVYQQASLFFYDEPNSSRFFSLFSSLSYVIWLLAGFFVRSTTKKHVGIFPDYLQRHSLGLFALILCSFFTFHWLVFPLWFR